MGFIDTILFPIKWVVAWILVLFHHGMTFIGLDASSGLNWVLSIVGLTVVIRLVLVPLFFRQIKAQRGMQALQPELMKLQAKYKGKTDSFSRQAMGQEQMALYKRHGTNPLSSCLPILAQMPIFFSLFRVLRGLQDIAAGNQDAIGGLTQGLAQQAEKSSLFGASLSDSFLSSPELHVKVLIAIMIVIMMVTQFITQKQIMSKNMSEAAMNNPFMKQQKMMLYLFPLIFVFGGVSFPVGVLIYWVISNLWTMGQQFYQIERMPAPGSPAEKALMEKRKKKGLPPLPGLKKLESDDEEPAAAPRGQRQQPVRKDRAKSGPPSTTPQTSARQGAQRPAGQTPGKSSGQQPGRKPADSDARKAGQPPAAGHPGGQKSPGQRAQPSKSGASKAARAQAPGKPGQNKPASGKPAPAKPSQGKPAQSRPANSGKKSQSKPSGAKRPSQSKPQSPRSND
ncbi:membrane protein insertase YidC [Spelaeicoccus albus]|uniref:Membrane protein insertase YidC n=1 Tax=Spelaeicoccus albus TaxID=1280376 RepID=A0A7Z0A940_9MICO|nr:membrane protein insertase YidC [Spelaeicoccus albus]NYI66587.1 YidC/Oxa1 family membrane protein insertase [Spelaeicoccus albus]